MKKSIAHAARRGLLALCATLATLPAVAAPAAPDFSSSGAILRWIVRYHEDGKPADVGEAARAMSRIGAFHNPDGAGVYVGFLAGVVGATPHRADELAVRLATLPEQDRWVAVRAVAWSGHPDWRNVLRRLATRLPERRAMINHYLAGGMPTLHQLAIAVDERGLLRKVKDYIRFDGKDFAGADATKAKSATLAPTPDLIDALWGYYFATRAVQPVDRIVAMLRWAKDGDHVDRLTLGAMAKLTLSTNAARDPDLLALMKRLRPYQRPPVARELDEAIEAAETVNLGPIRTRALAAIEEIKTKGSASGRSIAWWSRAGESAIALGCIGAAVAGQVQLGLPCVVGGAVSSATMKMLGSGG
jgi:hypothetical protein